MVKLRLYIYILTLHLIHVETESSFICSNAPLTAQDGDSSSITMPAAHPSLEPSAERRRMTHSHIRSHPPLPNKDKASKNLLGLTPAAANHFGPQMDETEHVRPCKDSIYDACCSQDSFLSVKGKLERNGRSLATAFCVRAKSHANIGPLAVFGMEDCPLSLPNT